MKKLIILPLLLVNYSINASIIGYVSTEPAFYEVILIGAMAIMTLVLLVIAFTLQGFVKSLLPKEEKNRVLEKALKDRTFLQKVFSLKPLSMEKEWKRTYHGIVQFW